MRRATARVRENDSEQQKRWFQTGSGRHGGAMLTP